MSLGLGLGISLWSNQAAVSGGGGTSTQWSVANSSSNWTISGAGNTNGLHNGTAWDALRANTAKTTGNFTVTIPTFVGFVQIGLGTAAVVNTLSVPATDSHAVVIEVYSGNIYVAGSLVGTSSSSYNDGDTVKVVNASGMVSFYHNGTLINSPYDATGIGSSLFPIAAATVNGQTITADFTNW